jgi:hypothetical protein
MNRIDKLVGNQLSKISKMLPDKTELLTKSKESLHIEL